MTNVKPSKHRTVRIRFTGTDGNTRRPLNDSASVEVVRIDIGLLSRLPKNAISRLSSRGVSPANRRGRHCAGVALLG